MVFNFCDVPLLIFVECSSPTYGAGCAERCYNCEDNACDHVNGRCENGCKRGYRGAFCDQECPAPSYGQNCAEKCDTCKNGTCRHTDGRCDDGCVPGYEGSRCDIGNNVYVNRHLRECYILLTKQ